MRIKAGASWRLPRFTTAAGVAMQSGSVGSGYKRSATGCCGLMPGGPEGLIDGKAPGRAPKLNDAQRQELARIIESGPIPAIHGVVRWRLIDLAQWVWEEYRVRVAKQTLSRQLRAMGSGFRKLSARPRHLLMDQAGWHSSAKLEVPDNITIVLFPPRSPVLNPVENVWQFMRDNWLSNRVFTSYDDIVDHCCEAWNKLVDRSWARAIGPIGHDHRDLVLV